MAIGESILDWLGSLPNTLHVKLTRYADELDAIPEQGFVEQALAGNPALDPQIPDALGLHNDLVYLPRPELAQRCRNTTAGQRLSELGVMHGYNPKTGLFVPQYVEDPTQNGASLQEVVIGLTQEEFQKRYGFVPGAELLHKACMLWEVDTMLAAGIDTFLSARMLMVSMLKKEAAAQQVPASALAVLEDDFGVPRSLTGYENEIARVGQWVDACIGGDEPALAAIREELAAGGSHVFAYVVDLIADACIELTQSEVTPERLARYTAIVETLLRANNVWQGLDAASMERVSMLRNGLLYLRELIFFHTHPQTFRIVNGAISERLPVPFQYRLNTAFVDRLIGGTLRKSRILREAKGDMRVMTSIKTVRSTAAYIIEQDAIRRELVTTATAMQIAVPEPTTTVAIMDLLEAVLANNDGQYAVEKSKFLVTFANASRALYDIVRCRIVVGDETTFNQSIASVQRILKSLPRGERHKLGEQARVYLRESHYYLNNRGKRTEVDLRSLVSPAAYVQKILASLAEDELAYCAVHFRLPCFYRLRNHRRRVPITTEGQIVLACMLGMNLALDESYQIAQEHGLAAAGIGAFDIVYLQNNARADMIA
jgi:hypothetical protein